MACDFPYPLQAHPMDSTSTSCPIPRACPESEQPSAASELAAAASIEAMSIDDVSVAHVGPHTTCGTTATAEALQPIDANAGEPELLTPFRISNQQSGESAP